MRFFKMSHAAAMPRQVHHRANPRRIMLPVLVLCCSFVCWPLPTSAGNDWLQKGKSLLGTIGQSQPSSALSSADMGAGLKDALRVGSENVVGQLGRPGGFLKDKAIHIPLPDKLNTVKTVLGKAGMGGMLDDLEVRLNRAAEAATPKAKQLFGQAITDMTMTDAKAIFSGPPDAATSYFKGKMTPALSKEMRPVVESSLAEAGAVKAYGNVMGKYKALPFVPDAQADLASYVTEKGLDGIFHYLALEEAAIRQNPAKRTTELLQRVFGSK